MLDAALREQLRQPADAVPDGQVVPQHALALVADGADARGDAPVDLGEQGLVEADRLRLAPQVDDGAHVDEAVEGGDRRGPVPRAVEDLQPQLRRTLAGPDDGLEVREREAPAGDSLRHRDRLFQLLLDVVDLVRLRGLEEKRACR